MSLKTGSILDGVVINITKFGAFVEVEGKTGLVHISEVADDYVKEIRDHLKEQDKVKVKVLAVDDNGKISLSIKQASAPKKSSRPADVEWSKPKKPAKNFEDLMSSFLKESEEKMSEFKKSQEVKGRKKGSV